MSLPSVPSYYLVCASRRSRKVLVYHRCCSVISWIFYTMCYLAQNLLFPPERSARPRNISLKCRLRTYRTRVAQLLTGHPRPFVLYFTLGSLLSICSSFFLTGPWKQIKKMFAPVRAVATGIYLTTLALTLFVALSPYARVPGQGIVLLCLVAVQFLSYVWYTLSYVPFARRFMAGFWSGLRGRT